MSNMTVTQRSQFERVDLSVPSTGTRVRDRRPVIAYTVLATVLLGALGYATAVDDRRLGPGDRARRDHAHRGRRDDRGQPAAPRLTPPARARNGRTTRGPATAGPLGTSSAGRAAGQATAAAFSESLVAASVCETASGIGSLTLRPIRTSLAITRRWICDVPS